MKLPLEFYWICHLGFKLNWIHDCFQQDISIQNFFISSSSFSFVVQSLTTSFYSLTMNSISFEFSD
ncbi:MAG: hypothetical protein CL626_09770 [Aurantimonas sp.]|nr:hypothetical protein [Aurantimonas sp.]